MAEDLQYYIKVSYDEKEIQKQMQNLLKQLQEQNKLVLDATINITTWKTTLSTLAASLAGTQMVDRRR